MAYERSPQDLRASDVEREAAADRLRAAALEGRLDPAELDERLSHAFAARWRSELTALTADVTPAPLGPPVFTRSAPTNGFAIASLICGLFWMAWFGSVLAIVFGHVALSQISRAQGRQGGRGIAVAGLALGYFGALVLVLMFAAFAVV